MRFEFGLSKGALAGLWITVSRIYFYTNAVHEFFYQQQAFECF
jgi:hypothetical protein